MNFKIQQYNSTQKSILQEIFKGNECTRASLVETTGLSNLTITKMIAKFIEDGVVIENGSLASTGGRKPSALTINPEFGYTLSIDIGTYSVKFGIVKFNGEILDFEQILYYHEEIPVKTITIEELQNKISEKFEKYGKQQFLGIGIGISGMVDYSNGTVVFCPNITGYNNTKIRDILQKKFDLPVFLDTSARCMALAEQNFGCGRSSKNLMLMSLGFSITAGIILNSRIYRGTSGFSGEIGHTQVLGGKDLCTCGNVGCLELYATIPMIRSSVIEQLSSFSGYSPAKQMFPNFQSITVDQIAQAYKAGDKIVENEIIKVSGMIGSAIAGCLNILNLDQVVLSGGLIELFPGMAEEVSRATMKRCLITARKDLTIKASTLGIHSSVQGAAVQILQNYFGNVRLKMIDRKRPTKRE